MSEISKSFLILDKLLKNFCVSIYLIPKSEDENEENQNIIPY
jgi:hypothetical protein